MDADAAARAWIDAWDRAWHALDAGLLVGTYTEDAVYRSHPFREPQHPVDYARGAFAEEEGDPELWWGTPLSAGARAAVEWWAVVVENDERTTLAGMSFLHFAADGRVDEQHDYWAGSPGRVEPWGQLG